MLKNVVFLDRDAQQILTEKDLHPDHVAPDLYAAAQWLIDSRS